MPIYSATSDWLMWSLSFANLPVWAPPICMFRVFLILENAHLPFLFPVSTLHPNYLETHLSLEAIYFAELSKSRMIFKGKRGEALLPLSSSSSLWATGMDESKGEVTQSCWTLCNPMNCSLPGFFVHGIFQARILEWVAISFSRRSSCPRDWTWASRIVGRRFYRLRHQGSPGVDNCH